jgi:tRNA-splicing ligase RtcB
MKVIHNETQRVPIKAWIDHVPIEDQAMQQLRNLAQMPFMYKHVAAMPDVHWGMGATVGSVIATSGVIIPAAVGVDIGCGMMAVKLNVTAKDLPDNLQAMRSEIERRVPHGRTDNGGKGDLGAWHDVPNENSALWAGKFAADYDELCKKHPKMKAHNTANHLGTLGSGNHFVEVCLDTEQNVWIMLHSGSRGLGNKVGMYFIERAKEEMRRWFISLPDEDLAFLAQDTELYKDYCAALNLAQEFAMANRALMMKAALEALRNDIPQAEVTDTAVNCHHNYVAWENHFGKNVIITRKGAVRARKTDLGIIPGSMGAKSFIVRGKGNEESFCSCSHGAGRLMSRNEAKKQFTVEQHIKDTAGVECRKDAEVIDETPRAYKNIDDVMKSQEDLVEIVATLKQVLCVKG